MGDAGRPGVGVGAKGLAGPLPAAAGWACGRGVRGPRDHSRWRSELSLVKRAEL